MEFVGKGVYIWTGLKTGQTLKKGVNMCRLKIYHESQSTKPIVTNYALSNPRNSQRNDRTNGLCL